MVASEEPKGVELVVHLADEPARAFQQSGRELGRPVLSLATDDRVAEAERLKAQGGGVRQGTRPDALRRYGLVLDDTCGNLLNFHPD